MTKMILKPKKCPDCGKEFKPLNGWCIRCYECYQRTKHTKQAKVEKVAKLKEIDKKVDAIQAVSRPLVDEEKAKVAYLLGRFTSIADIIEFFRRDGGKEIAYESIKSIRDSKKWQPIVEKERKEWLSRIAEVPIANKRVRLEAWQEMLEKGLSSNKMATVKNALIGARDEIEGIQSAIGNNYNLTYIASMSDNELVRKRDELLGKIKNITASLPKEPDQIELEPEIEDVEYAQEIGEVKV